jgi:hypothetical protein
MKNLCFKVNKVPTSPNVNFFHFLAFLMAHKLGRKELEPLFHPNFQQYKYVDQGFFFSILWYHKFGEKFQKVRKINEFALEKINPNVFQIFWVETITKLVQHIYEQIKTIKH